MGISGSQKALMYALGGIARGGATRGGYVGPKVFVKVAGVQRANDKSTAQDKVEDLSLHLGVNEVPDTLTFSAHGWIPVKGSAVEVTIGSVNRIKKEFAGKILSTARTVANLNGIARWVVNCVDTTWNLNDLKVNARYTGKTIAFVAADLIAVFAPNYTVVVDATFGALVLDEISFTNQELTDALTQLVNRGGGYWDCDYANVVRLYENDSARTPPIALTSSHISLENITVEEDLSQFFTRVYVEGMGSSAAATVAAGETILPLQSIAVFPSGNGLFRSGPQRCSYTGRTEVAPSTGPTVVAVAGTGLTPASNYQYAQTFVTGSGETVPSPVSLVSTGVTTPPASAPVAGTPTGAGSVDIGSHDYEVTFVTSAGETTPSPISGQQTTGFVTPPSAPTIFNANPGTTGYRAAWLPVAGNTLRIGYSATNAAGETTAALSNAITVQDAGFGDGSVLNVFLGAPYIPSYPSGSTDIRVYLHINGSYSGTYFKASDGLGAGIFPAVHYSGSPSGSNTAAVKTIPLSSIPIGGSDTTSRKIYRRFNGSGTFKLAATLADNITTTLNDTIANSGLGANAPSSNTAVAERVLVTIALGPAGTTGRKVYRTAAGSTQLKLQSTTSDNTTTSLTDSTADGSLGANAPTSDTSGLSFTGFALTSGSHASGATTLNVDSATPFISTGGWVRVGDMTLRYTGKGATTLTGIPSTGVGSITATIPASSLVQGLVALTGIPASGNGSIKYGINVGDEVNLVAQVDDTAAQTVLASLIGGTGIREDTIQDQRVSYPEAVDRGRAYLGLRALVRVTVSYTVKDLRTNGAGTIDVNLPLPVDLVGSFKILEVTIDGWQQNIYPLRHVRASTERFSLEDLLRRARELKS